MRFKPVDLSFTNRSIRQLHGSFTFPLPPAAFAVRPVQIAPDVHAPARSNGFDVSDLAEELKFRHELSLLRYTANLDRAAAKKVTIEKTPDPPLRVQGFVRD